MQGNLSIPPEKGPGLGQDRDGLTLFFCLNRAHYLSPQEIVEVFVTISSPQPSSFREVVGVLHDRERFQSAVERLVAAGFSRTDLSVLSSHESLDAAAGRGSKKWKDVLIALVGELKYEGPLVAAGLIALAAGPVGSAIAGLVAAGVGGAAAKEIFDEVSATPNSEAFARALAAGSIILWVAVRDQEAEARAVSILQGAGADNIHPFERTVL